MVGVKQQEREDIIIRNTILKNIDKKNTEIHKILKELGVFVSLNKVIQRRSYMKKPAGEKYIHIVTETELGQSIKWKDTSPDRVQDYPIFTKTMNKRKSLPWE